MIIFIMQMNVNHITWTDDSQLMKWEIINAKMDFDRYFWKKKPIIFPFSIHRIIASHWKLDEKKLFVWIFCDVCKLQLRVVSKVANLFAWMYDILFICRPGFVWSACATGLHSRTDETVSIRFSHKKAAQLTEFKPLTKAIALYYFTLTNCHLSFVSTLKMI